MRTDPPITSDHEKQLGHWDSPPAKDLREWTTFNQIELAGIRSSPPAQGTSLFQINPHAGCNPLGNYKNVCGTRKSRPLLASATIPNSPRTASVSLLVRASHPEAVSEPGYQETTNGCATLFLYEVESKHAQLDQARPRENPKLQGLHVSVRGCSHRRR